MTDDQLLLSQDEIDALLASSNPDAAFQPKAVPQAAEPVEEPIKAYDFRQPDRFSKEQMRALRLIHETWARRVSVSLSAHLRTAVEVNLADIDQGVYGTMVQQIPDLGVYYIVSLPPLPGHLMLFMNLDLAMVVLDRMMGGAGTIYRPGRTLTDLEFSLLRSIAEKVLVDFQESWANTSQFTPKIEDVASSLLLVPLGLPTDAILWMSFEIRLNGNASAMVLGLPYAMLKPVANRLSPYIWVASAEPNGMDGGNQQRRDVAASLGRTKTIVSVELGSTVLTLLELGSLRSGDVLPLNRRVGEMCDVLVNGQHKYRGRPGVVKHRMAIQVEEVVTEEWMSPEMAEMAE